MGSILNPIHVTIAFHVRNVMHENTARSLFHQQSESKRTSMFFPWIDNQVALSNVRLGKKCLAF